MSRSRLVLPAADDRGTDGRARKPEDFSRRYFLRELQAVNSHSSQLLHFPLQRARAGLDLGLGRGQGAVVAAAAVGEGSGEGDGGGAASPRHQVPVPLSGDGRPGEPAAPSSSSGRMDGDDSFALYRHVLASKGTMLDTHPRHAMPPTRCEPSSHGPVSIPIPVPVPVPVMVAGRRSLKASVRFAMPSASDDAEEQLGLGLGLGLGPGASLCVCVCVCLYVSCKTCALLSAVSLRGAALSGAFLQRQPDLVAGAASAAATAV